jgi:hypothetical protein
MVGGAPALIPEFVLKTKAFCPVYANVPLNVQRHALISLHDSRDTGVNV